MWAGWPLQALRVRYDYLRRLVREGILNQQSASAGFVSSTCFPDHKETGIRDLRARAIYMNLSARMSGPNKTHHLHIFLKFPDEWTFGRLSSIQIQVRATSIEGNPRIRLWKSDDIGINVSWHSITVVVAFVFLPAICALVFVAAAVRTECMRTAMVPGKAHLRSMPNMASGRIRLVR